ncbi:ABC transporter [Fusarium austroafricanum]|uniref:ABC transporter n=1 Tax=Fusarium austroafricanum TaxID=2364996 RepID=A0A8H4KI38_9HYPO|nr:ABC transporter [Fusarium austroafricanum]
MALAGCPSDATFGPVVKGCRGDFDFTLTFERIFLSIVPACIFSILSIVRSSWLIQKPTIVAAPVLNVVKLTTIFVYAVLRLALLILASTSGRHSPLSVPSTTLEFIAALAILPLSLLEHSKSLRPSMILAAYLFLALLCDITQTRTLWLVAGDKAQDNFARVFTTATALRAALVIIESKQKSRWVQSQDKEHGPEDTSGLYSLASFLWVNPLFIRGYNKVLTDDDLLSLGPTMSTGDLGRRLSSILEVNAIQGRKDGLVLALSRVLAVPLLLPAAPRLALLGFTFSQPFLIHTVLAYLVSLKEGTENKNSAYGLIGAAIFIYTGIALSTALYRYLHERALWMARGALAHCIYKKLLQSRVSDTSDSAALTLMSTDIERIRIGFKALHDFWASPIEVALASWMLYRNLGITFLAPIVLVAICVVCIGLLSTLFGSRQAAWMQKIEKRVSITSNTISNMKHLKIANLTAPMETLVRRQREDEIRIGGKWRGLMILATFIGFAPVLMGPVITFALTSRALDVTKLFTSLAFLTFLTVPLTQLIQFIPPLLASFTCLERIQSFLAKDVRVDYRDFNTSPPLDNPDTGSLADRSSFAIEVENGSFGWDKDDAILHHLNFRIPASGLTMIVGPVASGKSTLCKALLGETTMYTGRVTMLRASQVIGYCEQVPFLTNATIRENIIGFSSFNETKYNEVIHATMLLPDLSKFPQGDNTRVGSNGITLSGGQKQRVSLARALYMDTDLVIFDDIFSGLDADTEEQVFDRVFGPGGLISRRNATAILCTHSVQHLPSAQHVIALGHDGCIVEQGSYEALVANQDYIHGLGVSRPRPPPSSNHTIVEAASAVQTTITSSHSSSHTEKLSRQVGDSTVYKHYIQSNKPLTLIAFLIVDAAIGFLWNYPQIWLSDWAEDIVKLNPSHSRAYWVGIYALLSVLCLMCIAFAGMLVFLFIVAQSGTTLHHAALRTVIGAPLRFFTKTDAGVTTNLFSQDMTLIDTELPQALLNLMISIFVVIGMAAVVVTSSPYIAISYPFLIVLLWMVQKFYLRTSRQLRLMELEAKSSLYTQFADTLTGVASLRAFDWVDASLELNNRLVDISQTPAYLLAMIQHWLTFILQLVVALIATLVVVLTTQVKLLTRAGFVGASLATLMSFGETVTILIMMYTLLETSLGAVSRLKSFSDDVIPENIADGEFVDPPPSWPQSGAIEIKNISASYTGKSSIVLLLLRLLDYLPGDDSLAVIDGIPLHQVDRSVLRDRIIAIPQDPVFFPDDTSIKDNLDPLGISTADECHEVLKLVGLWPFVEKRGGLENGTTIDTFSQGQKQQFSLARAIIRRRVRTRETLKCADHFGPILERGIGGVLLLDEVSASVDKNTEREMQTTIQHEFADYTVIMVSHRQDVVMNSDKVFVIDDGSVVEYGNPHIS